MAREHQVKAIFVTQIMVKDPDSGGEVELEVWKDPSSGGLVAYDTSFMDQVDDRFESPYNKGIILESPDDPAKTPKVL
jgi:hypothetical protein